MKQGESDDAQITLTVEEAELAISYIGNDGTHTAPVKLNRKEANKLFSLNKTSSETEKTSVNVELLFALDIGGFQATKQRLGGGKR